MEILSTEEKREEYLIPNAIQKYINEIKHKLQFAIFKNLKIRGLAKSL